MLGELLASQERLTEWVPGGGGGGVTPVPVRPRLAAEVELIIALTVALAAPAAEGVNVMVPVVLWPALSVNGRVTPLMENTVEFIENCVTVKLEPPVLDMEIVRALLLPTFTLPKSRLAEENEKTPAPGGGGGGGGVVVADAPPPQPVIQ